MNPADAVPGDEAVAQLRGVAKSYEEGGQRRAVLESVDFAIGHAQTVVIRGPSGSGKTTVLNLLGGLDLPDQGSVSAWGVDLATVDDRRRTLLRRRHVGFVFQFFNLIEGLTVAENLAFPLALLGRDATPDRARRDQLLRRVGLWDRRDSAIDRLSGGERQRVAVARAVVHRPALILADEPTGNLDAGAGSEVLDLLTDLVRDLGSSLVLVTHSEAAAARGERILDLRAGRLIPA